MRFFNTAIVAWDGSRTICIGVLWLGRTREEYWFGCAVLSLSDGGIAGGRMVYVEWGWWRFG